MFIDAKTLIEQLGASPIPNQEGHFHLNLEPLALKSIQAQPVNGSATLQVLSAEAFCFNEPAQMKALGPLWIEGLDHKSQVISAIQDAIYRLGRKLKLQIQSLKQWGLRDVCIDVSDSCSQGYYEFQDSRFLYRLLDNQHVILIAVDETLIENSKMRLSLPQGGERQALEQGAKDHYQQYFERTPPAIVPVLPAFGTGSRPVFERISHLEGALSDLKKQIKKVESELISLKSVITFTPVATTSPIQPSLNVTNKKTKDSVHTLAHLIAPINEQVHVNVDVPPAEQDFDAPIETVAMDMVDVSAVNPSDFESDHGDMAPTSVSPMLLTPDGEMGASGSTSVGGNDNDFEEIKDTVAMDLVGAKNILLGDATEGESEERHQRGQTQTDEEVASIKEHAVEKQVADLLAQAPENDMGGFGKSYTGEHVFDANPLVHSLNTQASRDKLSEDFESEKSTDAALMVERESKPTAPPLTGVFELGDIDADILDADAGFVKEPPPWRPEGAQDSLVSNSEDPDDVFGEVTGPSELAFVGESEFALSEEVSSQDILEVSADTDGEIHSRVALVLKHQKALGKLNEKLKTRIPGLTPAMSCLDLEDYLQRDEIRWLVFVRPSKTTLSELQDVKARFKNLKVIVVSNDQQTFGDAVEVDHLLPLVNQVSEVAQMIVEILD